MFTLYRRLRAGCKQRPSRRYKAGFCPIRAQGTLDGESVRRSLDLMKWEAAIKRVRELGVHGQGMLVKNCVGRVLNDRRTMKLSDAIMRKYRPR